MQGSVKVFYKVLCDNEKSHEIYLNDLLEHNGIKKAIKSAFTSGRKDIDITCSDDDVKIFIEPHRDIHEMIIAKNDIQDMLSLAEEDAKKKRKLKKGCERIDIVDFETEH